MNVSHMKPELERRLSCGESVRMISKSLGVDHSTLSKAMKAAGIKVPTRNESAKFTWKNHKHPHLGKRGPASYMYGRHNSPESIEKMKRAISGENNYHWSGGRKKHSGGYILVYAPDHPYRDRNGFVLEHRLVMERHVGRILSDDEIVHHKNEDKSDNRLENLQIMTRAEHLRHHMRKRKENANNVE